MEKRMGTSTKLAAAFLLALTAALASAEQQVSPPDGGETARMDRIMQQIRSVEDPEERARLLEQHLDEMHASMARMHETMGQMMKHVEEQRTERRRLHDHRRMK
jgi:TolA-binding protein